MAKTIIDQITMDEFGNVLWRERTDYVVDGEKFSRNHRRSIGPKDDLKGLPEKVVAIAKIARKDATPVPETEG
jgi:hypothetical protein